MSIRFWVSSPSSSSLKILIKVFCLLSPVVPAAVLQELVPADQAVAVGVHAGEHLLHDGEPCPPLSLGPHKVIDGVCNLG